MQDQTTQVDDLQLVALPSAIGCAALFVQFTLSEWRLRSVLEDVTDATKRLVRTVVDTVEEGPAPAPITVRLRLRGEALVTEVETGPDTPPLAMPAALAARSNGVVILENDGQLIWCEVPLPTGMHATAVALPRRGTTKARIEASPEGEDPNVDMEVMARILDSLNRKFDEPAG